MPTKPKTSDRLVACRICHHPPYEAVDLTEHIRDYHAITVEEYKKDFPDAPISWKDKDIEEDEKKYIDRMKEQMDERFRGGAGILRAKIDPQTREKILSEIEKFEKERETSLHNIEEALRKYPETEAKERARSLIGQCRTLEIKYFALQKMALDRDELVSEAEMNISKMVLQTVGTLKDMLKVLEQEYQTELAHEDTVKIYQEEQRKIKEFVQQNIGEFSFRCNNCHHILEAGGLDKWYYEYENEDKDTKYHVWSRELWFLWEKGIIPYWIIPFVLRTGVLGVLYTYRKRNNIDNMDSALKKLGISWEDLEKQEEQYKEILQEWEEKELKEYKETFGDE